MPIQDRSQARTEEGEGDRLVLCGECQGEGRGPYTRREIREHLGPSGVHRAAWANGVGPPSNQRREAVA